MKQILTPLAIVAVAVVLAAGIIASRPEAEQAVQQRRALLVDTVSVAKQDIKVTVKAQGVVTPRTETTLVSEVSGKVMEVAPAFLAGGFFRKGDLLLKIDDRNYRSQLKRAESAVARARSELAQEKGRGVVAKKDWLKRNNTDHIDSSAKSLALREPQLLHAEANLASALADLENARVDLARTQIRAPYDGLVRQKQVDVGQYVNAGTPIGVTFAVDRAEIRLALPENKLSLIELPDAYSASSDKERFPKVTLSSTVDDNATTWSARLVRSEGVLDDMRRVLFVVAQIEDPYGFNLSEAVKQQAKFKPLRIGSFVDAEIEGRLMEGLIRLPRHVLRAGNKIWVIDENEQLREAMVKVLRTDGEFLYVKSGLNNGDRVCLTSVGAVLPGTPVRIASHSDQLSSHIAEAP